MFRVLSASEHEAVCRRCGMSCFTPIHIGDDSVIIPEIYCRYLAPDAESPGRYKCTVYEKRHEIAPWCKTVPEAIALNALAWDCPYAAGTPGFKGKRWAKDWEHAAIVEMLRPALIEFGLPSQDNPDGALRILDPAGKGNWSYVLEGDHFRFVETSPDVGGPAPSSRCIANTDFELHQDLSFL